jgi:hypothetical protein
MTSLLHQVLEPVGQIFDLQLLRFREIGWSRRCLVRIEEDRLPVVDDIVELAEVETELGPASAQIVRYRNGVATDGIGCFHKFLGRHVAIAPLAITTKHPESDCETIMILLWHKLLYHDLRIFERAERDLT